MNRLFEDVLAYAVSVSHHI